jgi:hypothetical protein
MVERLVPRLVLTAVTGFSQGRPLLQYVKCFRDITLVLGHDMADVGKPGW